MVVIMKPRTSEEDVEKVISYIKDMGLDVMINKGVDCTVLGLLGDTSLVDPGTLMLNVHVDRVMRIAEPFKKASRKFHPESTAVKIGDVSIGAESAFTVIAGPCSIESEDQILEVARAVKAVGATMLRGGAFKPRTSPYDFQGLRADGIELLLEAKKETGLPIVTEIMSATHLPLFEDVDVIQVGARNMQNFELLKELGKTKKPILLKRGLANTLKEFLMSAEYIMAGGNENIILCERGVRTFETYTRNTLDLAAVPMLQELTHLPIIVDPSHATGLSRLVKPMSLGAAAVGADGVMIEVHNNPQKALCDGPQSLTPAQFADVMKAIKGVLAAL